MTWTLKLFGLTIFELVLSDEAPVVIHNTGGSFELAAVAPEDDSYYEYEEDLGFGFRRPS